MILQIALGIVVILAILWGLGQLPDSPFRRLPRRGPDNRNGPDPRY